MKKIIALLLTDPKKFMNYAYSKFQNLLLKRSSNIKIQGDIYIRGKPIIDIKDKANLYIGDGVTLNSKNHGYHINMHSPVKLLADNDNATIKIGNKTRIYGTCLHAQESISIGENCLIAANCQIMDCNGHDNSFHNVANRINTSGSTRPVIIEDNVWIGANSIILPGVKIGSGSIISANSVVLKNIPPMVVAGGNPAKVIKFFDT